MNTLAHELTELHYNTMKLIEALEELSHKYPLNKGLLEQLEKAEEIHNVIRERRYNYET